MVTRNQLIGVVIVGVIITAAVTAAIMFYALRIRGTGRIKIIGLEAYGDPEATQPISEIDWGELTPGGFSEVILYLKSISNAPANLTFLTEAWSPSAAQDFLTLEWDYDGSELQVGEVRGVLFTLRASSSITGFTNFEFDLVLTASG